MAGRKKIGAILREEGLITEEDVQRVLEYQRSQGGFFGQALVSLGLVSPAEVEQALARQLGLPREQAPQQPGGPDDPSPPARKKETK